MRSSSGSTATASPSSRSCSTSRSRCRAPGCSDAQAGGRELDKFEREAGAFFERVRDAYLERVARDPRRFRVIDSTRPLADVRAELAAHLAALEQAAR